MKLVQCTHENGYFFDLKSQWIAQIKNEEGEPKEFFDMYMEQAERICSEKPTDSRYGVYSLVDDSGVYHTLTHINHAVHLKTLRVIWSYSAPIYRGVNEDIIGTARILSETFRELWSMYKEKPVNELKIYCPSPYDRRIYASVAANLTQDSALNISTHIGGSWLHIK